LNIAQPYQGGSTVPQTGIGNISFPPPQPIYPPIPTVTVRKIKAIEYFPNGLIKRVEYEG
jgi:hypothetical protein